MYCKLRFIGSLNSNMRLLNFNCLLQNCRLATPVVTRQFCVRRINSVFPPCVQTVGLWLSDLIEAYQKKRIHIVKQYFSSTCGLEVRFLYWVYFIYLFYIFFFRAPIFCQIFGVNHSKGPGSSSSSRLLTLWEENDFQGVEVWRDTDENVPRLLFVCRRSSELTYRRCRHTIVVVITPGEASALQNIKVCSQVRWKAVWEDRRWV